MFSNLVRIRLSSCLSKISKCRCLATASSSSIGEGYFAKFKIGQKKTAEAEAVNPDAEFYTETPEYPPITVPFGSEGLEGIKAEKKEFAEHVKNLPTVQEKIFAVNPYERPWSHAEKRWHRDYMHPMPKQRATFRVNATPDHYNFLPFYQFITKTHIIDGLPSTFYEKQDIGRELEEFMPLAVELIQNEQKSYEHRGFSSTEYVGNVVDQLANAACMLFSSDTPHLAEAQIARDSSVQAAWIRGGFHTLYPDADKKPVRVHDPAWGTEIFGDDRRKLGEFAFCVREKVLVNLRNNSPLPNVVPMDDPLCRTPVTPFVYAPLKIGLFPDQDGPTYWTPGFEYGDQYEFSSLLFYPIDKVLPNILRYKGAKPGEAYEDCLRSISVSLAFSTLIGQAHYLGFTQHTDLTYPLTTQLILTDGQFWHFCIYQLNSIGLINHWEESDSPSNLAWCSGSMKLYDSVDSNGEFQGLNTDVLKHLLQFFLTQPEKPVDIEMRPYLLDHATAPEYLVKSAQVHAEAVSTLRR